MTQTALILGASGRFGRACATAFTQAGWRVERFDRRKDDLMRAAQGVDVIVNGWNPQYPDWATQVPGLHARVIDAAQVSGATVILPGNVYVFGPDAPTPWDARSPHLAQNPLGRIRVEMEAAYRNSGVRVILLRAGDYIDTTASGNWFDMVLTKGVVKGRFAYPGDPDVPHSWAYLPDLAHVAVSLAEQRSELPVYCDVPFAGYTLNGHEMVRALNRVLARQVRLKQMSWPPIQLLRPVWPLARCLVEMRYLWNLSHSLDGAHLQELLPGFRSTPLDQALRQAVPEETLRAPSQQTKGQLAEGPGHLVEL